jgi:hypothetical protein
MNQSVRPLTGCTVGLSISESEDSTNRGFPDWQVNRVTLQVVAALFGQGIGVVFGHDWRDDGVMEAVHGFAQQMQPPVPLSPAEVERTGQPLLRNLLPWPDKPKLSREDLERLASTLRIETVGLPDHLQAVQMEALRAGPESPVYRFLRARGLTFLRRRLNQICDTRVCLGGRRSGFVGRYPGIIEEALLALKSGKPLFLGGLLSGATKQVIDAIEGKRMPLDFCAGSRILDLYEQPPIRELDPSLAGDSDLDSAAVWREFQEAGPQQIASANMLTMAENEELLHTPVLDRVIHLVLVGLSRLRSHGKL